MTYLMLSQYISGERWLF